MSRYIRPGKNCQNYSDICNARSERGGTPGNYSIKDMSRDVLELLPKSVELMNGGSVDFLHFFATDGQQNTCKAIQVIQTLVIFVLLGHILIRASVVLCSHSRLTTLSWSICCSYVNPLLHSSAGFPQLCWGCGRSVCEWPSADLIVRLG